jgi:hypothetical protein
MSNLIPFFTPTFFTVLAKVFFLVVDLLLILFLSVFFKKVLYLNTIIDDVNDSLILRIGSFLLVVLAIWLFLTAVVIL